EEETNLTVDIDDVEFYKEIEKEDCIISYYIGSYYGENNIILDPIEHQRAEWILPENLPNKKFLLDLGDFLKDAFSQEVADSESLNKAFSNKILDFTNILNKALDSGGINDDQYLESLHKLSIIKSNDV